MFCCTIVCWTSGSSKISGWYRNLHTELHSKSYNSIGSTIFLLLEQIIHLDYLTLVHLFVDVWWRGDFALWRVSWRRSGFLVASWLVAKLPGGEMTGYPVLPATIDKLEWHCKTNVHLLQLTNKSIKSCGSQCISSRVKSCSKNLSLNAE